MGDALGGVFGSGGKQTTDNTVDPQSEALNKLRLQQLSGLFNTTPLSSFAGPKSDIYTGAPAVDSLFASATAPQDSSKVLGLDDYIKMGLDEGSNYISKVATPQILQTAALQGLEGGGYVPEAIGKATAGIALPFLNSLPQASLAAPQAGILGAQKAQTLFPLADYSRGLSQADFERQQQVSLAGLTGIPFTPVTDSTQKKSSQPLFNFFGQG